MVNLRRWLVVRSGSDVLVPDLLWDWVLNLGWGPSLANIFCVNCVHETDGVYIVIDDFYFQLYWDILVCLLKDWSLVDIHRIAMNLALMPLLYWRISGIRWNFVPNLHLFNCYLHILKCSNLFLCVWYWLICFRVDLVHGGQTHMVQVFFLLFLDMYTQNVLNS